MRRYRYRSAYTKYYWWTGSKNYRSGAMPNRRLCAGMTKISKYQHLKCTFWILVAAIIVLIVSLIIRCPPFESILQNIFAGLLTGIVVTLISSLKEKELKEDEIEDQFLKIVHDLYISSRREYIEYRKVRHEEDDVYYVGAYDLITELQAVEGFIESKDKDDRFVRILGKKPSEFFEDGKYYSLADQDKRHRELYDRLNSSTCFNEEERKAIDQQIEAIRRAHRVVNRKAMNRTEEIFNEKIEIETSIP